MGKNYAENTDPCGQRIDGDIGTTGPTEELAHARPRPQPIGRAAREFGRPDRIERLPLPAR